MKIETPERLCRNCEYFDGGGLGADGQPREFHGDCHNPASPRFETTGAQGVLSSVT